MKIYVAGKYEDRFRVRNVQDWLRNVGHTITFDWTYSEPSDDLRELARRDISGVADADLIVMILEQELPYRGTWVEFGVAAAYEIPVIIVGAYGENRDLHVFMNLPTVRLGIPALEAAVGATGFPVRRVQSGIMTALRKLFDFS